MNEIINEVVAWILAHHIAYRRGERYGIRLDWSMLSVVERAYLRGADLGGAYLRGADLGEKDAPRTLAEWQADPLAGLCDEPEARERAIAAWGDHSWGTCPMSVGMGIESVSGAPEAKRLRVAMFVALFDGGHLPKPAAAHGDEARAEGQVAAQEE